MKTRLNTCANNKGANQSARPFLGEKGTVCFSFLLLVAYILSILVCNSSS